MGIPYKMSNHLYNIEGKLKYSWNQDYLAPSHLFDLESRFQISKII